MSEQAWTPSGFTWSMPRSTRPEERSRIIWTCPLCDAWQLDAGSHETTAVVEALIGEHALGEHGFRSAVNFYGAVVAKREAESAARRTVRLAPFVALDDALRAMSHPWGTRSLIGELVQLHSLDRDHDDGVFCLGCDAGEFAESLADWPCRTIAVVVRRFDLPHEGIDLP